MPEPIQALLEHVSFEELAVESKQGVEFLPLVGGQVDPPAQQQPALSLDQPAQVPALAKKLCPPYFINSLVGMLHDVELVIDDAAAGSPLLDAQPKRLPHIYARHLDACSLPGAQFCIEELVQGLLLPLPPEPQRFTALQVARDGQEFLLLPQMDLIHSQLPQRRFVSP